MLIFKKFNNLTNEFKKIIMDDSEYEAISYYSERTRLFNKNQIDYINMHAIKNKGIGPSIPTLLLLNDEIPPFEDRHFKLDPNAPS